MTQTQVFRVNGMHCKSCVLLTEETLRELPGVTSAVSDLASKTVRVSGEFGSKDAATIAIELSRPLEPHGYSLSVDAGTPASDAVWGDFAYAAPIAAALVLGFMALQKVGLVNLIAAGEVTYVTAFFVGVVASLSTCMAVVGGLVLSMSATFAREGDRVRPQLLFHASRIAAFFVLGGVIGAVGATFRLSAMATFALGMAIGLVMLILGLNLLDVFPWAKKLQPSMPKFISRHALGAAKHQHVLMPVLVGIATFFLPCGFTQSMQLYTLTTGSFLAGALTMLAFALGTLPALALVSFSASGFKEGMKKRVFFKVAGLIVIAFALFNMANGLAAAGVIPPLFNI